MTHSPTLGIALPPYIPVGVLRDVAAAADESEIHSLWTTDRTVVDMPWMEALATLSALAVATRRVVVGSSVIVLPRRNPFLLAQALATVNHLSEGRLIAGFGVGDPRLTGPAELALAAVDPSQRGQTADDYLELLEQIWAGEEVSFDSHKCRADSAAVGLQPESAIPVWIGGSSAAACERAGRFGNGWLATMTTPDAYPEQFAAVREAAQTHGRDPEAITPAIYLFGAVDQDGTSSAERLDGALRGFIGAPLEAVADSCVWGTPQQWQDRIGTWREAGVEHITVALFSEDIAGDVALIGQDVLQPSIDLSQPA